MRIAFVSDSHLSPRVPETLANWDAAVRYLTASRPDVVVHLGDLTFDGAGDLDDLRHARAQLDRLPVAWLAVPGNHDLGDNPTVDAPPEGLVSEARRERWLDTIGPDHWRLRGDGWTLLAINAQLLGSGLRAEHSQWQWLEAQVGELAGSADHIALITHKPVAAPEAELEAAPAHRFLLPEARRKLLGLFTRQRLGLVVSGHVHQHRLLELEGIPHLWAPTTWAVLPDQAQPTFGAKRCGILTVDLRPDGTLESRRVEPEGLVQLTLGEDIRDPYRELHLR